MIKPNESLKLFKVSGSKFHENLKLETFKQNPYSAFTRKCFITS